jgi:hypothetical protein
LADPVWLRREAPGEVKTSVKGPAKLQCRHGVWPTHSWQLEPYQQLMLQAAAWLTHQEKDSL